MLGTHHCLSCGAHWQYNESRIGGKSGHFGLTLRTSAEIHQKRGQKPSHLGSKPPSRYRESTQTLPRCFPLLICLLEGKPCWGHLQRDERWQPSNRRKTDWRLSLEARRRLIVDADDPRDKTGLINQLQGLMGTKTETWRGLQKCSCLPGVFSWRRTSPQQKEGGGGVHESWQDSLPIAQEDPEMQASQGWTGMQEWSFSVEDLTEAGMSVIQ